MSDYPKRLTEIKESLAGDNGQTARTRLLAPCPFCGGEAFLQWGPVWGDGEVECRVVCSSCHVATSRDTARRTEVAATGEDVTSLAAADKAIARWNRRENDAQTVDRDSLLKFADEVSEMDDEVKRYDSIAVSCLLRVIAGRIRRACGVVG